MTTLAAVIAAWEDSTGKHTWRNPSAWDARVLGALIGWGYEPSEIESLLLPTETPDSEPTEEPTAEPAEEPASEPAADQPVAV